MKRSLFLKQWLSRTFTTPLLYIDLLAGSFAIVGWAAGYVLSGLGGTVRILLWAAPLTVLTVTVIVGAVYPTYLLMKRSVFFKQWLSRTFTTPLLYIDLLAGVFVFVGWVAGYALAGLGGTVRVLLWAVPLTVLTMTVLVSAVYAAYSLWKENADKPSADKNESNTTRNARPHIRFVGWETVEVPLTTTDGGTTQVVGRPWFTRVTFANSPDPATPGKEARNVVGHVEFYDASGERLLFGMVGRWADTLERAQARIRDVKGDQIDMPPDATPRSLDIVLKYDEDNECYGLSNDTAIHAPVDWRDERRKLGRGLYGVKIRLQGTGVDETFSFGLINRGSREKVRILHLTRQTQGTSSDHPQT